MAEEQDLAEQRFGAFLDEQASGFLANKARTSLLSVSEKSPDAEAKIQALSKQTGIAPELVERNQPEVERRVNDNAIDFDALARTHPKSAKFLSDPVRASLVKDEVDWLKDVELSADPGILKNTSDVVRAVGAGEVSGVGYMLAGTGEEMNVAYRSYMRSVGQPTAAATNWALSRVGLGQYNEADYAGDWGAEKSIVPDFLNPAKSFTTTGRAVKQYGESLMPEDQGLSTMIGQGVGQLGPQVAVSLLNPAVAFGAMTAQGAEIVADVAKEKGKYGTPSADVAILLGAGITGVTEKYGIDFMLGKVPPVVQKNVLDNLVRYAERIGINTDQMAVKFAGRTIGGGINEAGQEFTEGLFQAIDEKLLIDPNIPVIEGLGQQAGVGFGVGVIANAVLFNMLPGKARPMVKKPTEQAVSQAERMVSDTTDGKLFQRSPDAYKNLMETVHGEERFYIDGEAMSNVLTNFTEAQKGALMTAVPGLAEEITQAVDTGADVSMKKSDFATYIAPYEGANLLYEHLKLDPRDNSVFQTAAQQEFITANPELARVLTAELTPGAVSRETYQAIEQNVRKSMLAAGRDAAEARAVAPLFAKTLSRFGAAFDLSAIDLMTQRFLGFQQVDEQGNVISQGSNIGVLLKDYTTLSAGKTVAGADEQYKAAALDFGKRLEAAGITPEQAQGMEPKAVLDAVYPSRETITGAQSSQTLEQAGLPGQLTLPGVEVAQGPEGGTTINIRNPEVEAQTEANKKIISDKLFQTALPAQPKKPEQIYGLDNFFSQLYVGIKALKVEKATAQEWLNLIYSPASKKKKPVLTGEMKANKKGEMVKSNEQAKDPLGNLLWEEQDIPESSPLPGVKVSEIYWSGLPEWLNGIINPGNYKALQAADDRLGAAKFYFDKFNQNPEAAAAEKGIPVESYRKILEIDVALYEREFAFAKEFTSDAFHDIASQAIGHIESLEAVIAEEKQRLGEGKPPHLDLQSEEDKLKQSRQDLANAKKGILTKEDILEFFSESRVRIEEDVYERVTKKIKVPLKGKKAKKETGFDRSDYPTEEDVEWDGPEQQEPDRDTISSEQVYYVENFKEDEDAEKWYKAGNDGDLVQEPDDSVSEADREYEWDDDKLYDKFYDRAYESASDNAEFKIEATIGDTEYAVFYHPEGGAFGRRLGRNGNWRDITLDVRRPNEENVRAAILGAMLEENDIYTEDYVNELEDEWLTEQEEQGENRSEFISEGYKPETNETLSTPEEAITALKSGLKSVRVLSNYEDIKFLSEFDVPNLEEFIKQETFGERTFHTFDNQSPMKTDPATAKSAFDKGYKVLFMATETVLTEEAAEKGYPSITAGEVHPIETVEPFTDKKYLKATDDDMGHFMIVPKNAEVEGRDFRYEMEGTGEVFWKEYQLQGGHKGDYTYNEIAIKLPALGNRNVDRHGFGPSKHIILHIRFSERVDANGIRTLFIEEIQSDWGQMARDLRTGKIKKVAKEKRITRGEAKKLVPEDYGYLTPEKVTAATDRLAAAKREVVLEYNKLRQKLDAAYNENPTDEFLSGETWAEIDPELGGYDIKHNETTGLFTMRFGGEAVGITADTSFDNARDALHDIARRVAENTTEPEIVAAKEGVEELSDFIPTAPFMDVNQYISLAMKRVMIWAAHNDYNQVAWTPGWVQNNRWAGMLRAVVDKIEIIPKYEVFEKNGPMPSEEGVWARISNDGADNTNFLLDKGGAIEEWADTDGRMFAFVTPEILTNLGGEALSKKVMDKSKEEKEKPIMELPDGVDVVARENYRGKMEWVAIRKSNDNKWHGPSIGGSGVVYDNQEFTGETKSDVVIAIIAGQNAARGKYRAVSGDEITFESKGMLEAYDSITANKTKEILKKFNQKLKSTKFDGIKKSSERVKEEINKTGIIETHAFDITREMKDSILEGGLSLFQKERGSITFEGQQKDFAERLKKVTVTFTSQANRSTAIHEFSHWATAAHRLFAQMARQQIAQGNGNTEMQRIVDDWEKLKIEVGATEDIFTVEQEEKIAAKFEKYMATGEAPSADLQNIFTRFRVWLSHIYETLSGKDEEINPNIKSIFDNWLASEEEIAAVQEKNAGLAAIAQNFGLDINIVDKVAQHANASIAEAEEKLYKQLTREQNARETATYKKELAEMSAVVKAEMSSRREYNLMAYMRENGFKLLSGPETEGLPSDLVSDNIEETIHPDDLASLYGYDTGQQMIRALTNTPGIDKAADIEARKRLQVKYPDMIASGKIHSDAITAIVNDKVLLALDVLIKEIGKKANVKLPIGFRQFAKIMAQRQMDKMTVREASYAFRYEAARERAIRDALKASRKGNPQEALIHLQRAMVNHELFKALDAFTDVKEKAEELYYRVNKKDEKLAKGRDIDFVGAARFILSKFGLAREGFDINEWIADVQERDPDVMNDLAYMVEMVKAPSKPAPDLTIPEYIQVYHVVESIFHAAREQKEFQLGSRRVQAEAAEADLLAAMGEIKEPLSHSTQTVGWNKFRLYLSAGKAALRRVELWTKAMDGASEGSFRNYLWQPINDAEDAYKVARTKWMGGYRNILKKHKKRLSLRTKIATDMFKTDANGRSTQIIFNDVMEMIGFLLHTGNESNHDKLLGGYGINPESFHAAIAQLEATGQLLKEDWQLVQELWDYAEALKPLSQKAHKQLYGFRFEEIDAQPIISSHGTFRGGYWPAVVDATQSADAKTVEQMLDDTKMYMLATTNKGFTKSRKAGYRQPLSTDLALGSQHVDKVLRFIYLEPAARAVSRVIGRKGFREKLKAIDPDAYEGMLNPWLMRFAKQLTEPPNPGDRSAAAGRKWINFMRSSAVSQIIRYNPIIAAQNFANLSVAARQVGAWRLAASFVKMTVSPLNTYQEMMKSSAMMQERLTVAGTAINQEIDWIVNRKNVAVKGRDLALRYGFIFMHGIDSYLSGMVWTAAYNKEMEDHGDTARASSNADKIIREVMGAAGSKDVAKIEASSPVVKAIMPFFSFFSSQSNLIGTEFSNIMKKHGWAGTPQLFFAYISLIAVPAVVGQLIVDLLRSNLPDDKDDDGMVDDWLNWATISQLRYLGAMVPIAGQSINAVVNIAEGKPIDDRMSISPIVSGLGTVARTGQKIYKISEGKDIDDGAMIRDVMSSIGFVTGAPLGQLAKPVSYVAAVKEKKVQPKSPVDWGLGLVAGPPRKKK